MLERYFPQGRARERLLKNPHRQQIAEFVTYLEFHGYSNKTIHNYVWAVEHFMGWIHMEKRSLKRVDYSVVQLFLKSHLPKCHCPAPSPVGLVQVRPALKRLLSYLRSRKPANSCAFSSSLEKELNRYMYYLRSICGASESTRSVRRQHVREFLQGRGFGQNKSISKAIVPQDIMRFLAGYASRCKQSSVQGAASSLRSYVRYLNFRGRCHLSLLAAIPRIPNWRLSRIPKALTNRQLRSFLGAFDRSTQNGQRDYAMALCQAIMGMRSCEVAHLRLDDIDWHAGTIRINAGKTSTGRELPLVKRVGQAIVEYLRNSRPHDLSCRYLFLRHRAPHGPVSVDLIYGAFRLVFAKATQCKGVSGTHLLRHTAASFMLQRGANLKEIADVLGHHSVATTTIYTKVDLPSMRVVTAPWPEAAA